VIERDFKAKVGHDLEIKAVFINLTESVINILNVDVRIILGVLYL
jgi:hypothetical protein